MCVIHVFFSLYIRSVSQFQFIVIIKFIIFEYFIKYLELLHIGDEDADLIRRIGEYEQGKEEWIQCCETLESYFAANEALEEAKKKTIFLTDIDRFIFLQATKEFDITTKTKTHAKPWRNSLQYYITITALHHPK